MANAQFKIVVDFKTGFLKADKSQTFICGDYFWMIRVLKTIADDFPPMPCEIKLYKDTSLMGSCEHLPQLQSIIAREDYITSLTSKINAILNPSETRCYDRE